MRDDIQPGKQLLVRGARSTRTRRITLEPRVHLLLGMWRGERTKWRKRLGIKEAQPLFCTIEKKNFGSPLSPAYIRGMLARTAKKAGLSKKIDSGALRDALGFELRQTGFSRLAIAHFLGELQPSKRRFEERPELDARGADLCLDGWGHVEALRFSILASKLVPVDQDDQELRPIEDWVHYEGTRTGGLRTIRPDREQTTTRDVGERIRRLEEKVEELARLVKKLDAGMQSQAGHENEGDEDGSR
jgi:hypothetical protein